MTDDSSAEETGRGGAWTGPAWVGPVVLGSVVVLAVAVLFGGALWAAVRDDRPRAQAGQVIDPGGSRVVSGRSALVRIPSARLKIVVDDQVEEILTDSGDEFGTRAPRGGLFVGVSVMIDGPPRVTMPKTSWARVQAPRFTLVDGERRYPVHGLGADVSETAYVAVEDKPEDLRLELGYDGESRIVDLNGGPGTPGRFAALDAEPPAAHERDCGRAAWPAQFAQQGTDRPSCRILSAHRMPYVAGLGWAREGGAWLVVTQSARLPKEVRWRSPDGRRAGVYEVEAVARTPRFAFDRARADPAATVVDLSGGGAALHSSGPTQAIFAVDDAGEGLEISVTHDLDLDATTTAPGLPDDPVVPVSWYLTVS